MLQCWHVYYSVTFSRGQRGLQRTAETCGGGGSSGIDDKTRHVGLHVHSFTSEGFVILVLTRVNTSSEIRSFSHPPRFRIILVQYSVTKDLKHMSFAFACKRWQPLNGRFFDGFSKHVFFTCFARDLTNKLTLYLTVVIAKGVVAHLRHWTTPVECF